MSDKIPEGYSTVIPYLIIKNAAAFIEFTKNVFKAVLLNKHMRGEITVMHAEIKIGDSVIMFAESTDQYAIQPAGLFVYVNNADETFQSALNNGATIINKLSDQSYGRTGGVKDPFENTWWITSMI